MEGRPAHHPQNRLYLRLSSRAIYEIVSLDHDRVDCLKMEESSTNTSPPTTREETASAPVRISSEMGRNERHRLVELREETETYEVEKTVKRPIKPETKIEGAQSYEYTVREDVDTRDQTPIWLVKFIQSLTRNLRQGCKTDAGTWRILQQV